MADGDTEDFVSRIPVLNALTGSRSEAERELLRRFEEVANVYGDYRKRHAAAVGQGFNMGTEALGPMQQFMQMSHPGIQQNDLQGMRNGMSSLLFNLRADPSQPQGVTGGAGPRAMAQPYNTNVRSPEPLYVDPGVVTSTSPNSRNTGPQRPRPGGYTR